MEKYISVTPLAHDCAEEQVHIELPNECPNCQTAYAGLPLSAYYITSDFITGDETRIYSIFFCPRCERCFFVEYHAFEAHYHGPANATIYKVHPIHTSVSDFSKRIQNLSPKFVEIYHQSEIAEHNGLTEICGMGYRKALEFLVKDFAIASNPDKKSDICQALLSPCIDRFIDNKKIKSLAKASAWLGNDETHYVRKHNDYNLEHLKIFISAIVAFVDSELTYQMAENLLSSPKR